MFRRILLTFFIYLANTKNYIYKGGFETPVLPSSNYMLESADGWTGSQYEVIKLYTTLSHGQYVDLQYGPGKNGYLEQNITLPSSN